MTNAPKENIPDCFVFPSDGEFYIQAKDLFDLVEYSVEIDTFPGKHDTTRVIALLLFEDKPYQFSYYRSYNYGVSEDAGNCGLIQIFPVKPVEVSKIEWVLCSSVEGDF